MTRWRGGERWVSDQNSSLIAEISRVSIEKKKLSSLPQSPAFQPFQFTDSLDVSERQYESELKKGKPVCSWTWTAWHSGEGPSTKVMDVYLYRGVGVSESISCRGWRCLCFLILPGVLLCQNSTSSGACMYLAAWNVQRSTGSTQNHMTGHLQARSLTNHISSHTKPARAVNT